MGNQDQKLETFDHYSEVAGYLTIMPEQNVILEWTFD
jgi:hypothetical protein